MRVEQYCAFIERDGLAVNQFAADVAEFEDHLARRGVRRPAEQDLHEYPELGQATVRMVAWPPDRTGPCWCGATRKYKQCCRKHSLGTLP